MGLFRRKKTPEPEPARKPTQQPVKEQTVTVTDYVNLTDKNVKIDVPEDGLYVKDVYLWQEESTIRGMNGNKVLFEVTKRSKAYGELEPLARQKLKHIKLQKRTGDYGIYYRMGFAREITHDEAFGKVRR